MLNTAPIPSRIFDGAALSTSTRKRATRDGMTSRTGVSASFDMLTVQRKGPRTLVSSQQIWESVTSHGKSVSEEAEYP